MSSSDAVAAILLSGGSSRRFGRDKTQLEIDGMTLAVRTAAMLLTVVDTAIEAGPGVSGLPAVIDDHPGEGPLGGVAAAVRALRRDGHVGAALVVACDLPFLSSSLLRFLVEFDATGSVVPVVAGRAQPLCARWGAGDLDRAHHMFASGERSLRYLTEQTGVDLVDESRWGAFATSKDFLDVDSPDDARRLGIAL